MLRRAKLLLHFVCLFAIFLIDAALIHQAFAADAPAPKSSADASSSHVAAASHSPPAGFVSLFNGKDLSGWHGQDHFDPARLKGMKAAERAKKLKTDNADMKKHWKVKDGEIVNDGHGVYLTTDKDYGNFELHVDWKMSAHNGDSGIYLRGYPQVQIWDPANPREKNNGAEQGSGGLWNNGPGHAGRFPLVKADRPIGEWNALRIKMVGPKVTVHFNDKLVVDNAVLDNFFDRKSQVLPTGPIQLQTHGSEMRFKNIYIKELPSDDGK